ncbi:sporulation protein [Ilumatobacter sp.]|uniref:sporulation protein n=1 Tax=Ilumatobacter sp. TaxID=1967498 RepID=UPI003AF9FC4A
MTDTMTTPPASVFNEIRGHRDALTVGRVFGDAYEIDGLTVIPVGRVAGGGGGGAGEDSKPEGESDKGFGTGFGLSARGIGVYQVRDGEVTWKPAVDSTQLAKGGQVLAGIIAVCVTLVLLRRSG